MLILKMLKKAMGQRDKFNEKKPASIVVIRIIFLGNMPELIKNLLHLHVLYIKLFRVSNQRESAILSESRIFSTRKVFFYNNAF